MLDGGASLGVLEKREFLASVDIQSPDRLVHSLAFFSDRVLRINKIEQCNLIFMDTCISV
jgi:hypothetical protein